MNYLNDFDETPQPLQPSNTPGRNGKARGWCFKCEENRTYEETLSQGVCGYQCGSCFNFLDKSCIGKVPL